MPNDNDVTPTRDGHGGNDEAMEPTPNLDRFKALGSDDDARLALGLEVLEAAHREAWLTNQLGWQEVVWEYVVAVRDGKGLNRPL